MKSLYTSRLILKAYTAQDIISVFDNYGKEEIIAKMGYRTDAQYDKNRDNYTSGLIEGNKPLLMFKMIDKETHEIYGDCGYHNWFHNHHRAELGYQLYHDDYMQKGYMTEALKPIIEYGFETMKLNRIEACIYKDNEASLSLMRNLGFTYEGNLRQHYCSQGEFSDSMLFSLLAREYNIR
jgi:[ribosomal protein S5]-alanine N-acetyltransferase